MGLKVLDTMPELTAMRGPNVAAVHPEYEKMRPDWDLIRSFCDGSRAVKALGDEVLPRPNPADTSQVNALRFDQYLDRAVFYPVPGRTLDGYVGQVFADAPLVVLPAAIASLVENVDGAGVSIVQQASKALSYVVSRGRCGLLADYPPVASPATQAEVEALNLRPTVTLYDPESIVNWRTCQFGGVTKLVLLVIHESLAVRSDGFEQQFEESWRVLRLDAGGELTVDIWRRNKAEKGNFEIAEIDGVELSYKPTQNGKRMREIPFTFVGSKNNDTSCDNPPLLGLVELSKGHFRNSADYEESAYQCGSPTYYATGITEEWKDEAGVIPVGSRAFVLFPESSTAGILQAKPNSMAFEAMEHKEKQMVAVGAKLIETTKVATTATEVVTKEAATTSALAQMANNVSAAYQWILERALGFVSTASVGDGELVVRLSTDFRTNSLDPSDQAQLVANWQAGALTDKEMRDQFKRGSMTTASPAEWLAWYKAKKKEDEAAEAAKVKPALKTVATAKKEEVTE